MPGVQCGDHVVQQLCLEDVSNDTNCGVFPGGISLPSNHDSSLDYLIEYDEKKELKTARFGWMS
jgi:hypothetical protein